MIISLSCLVFLVNEDLVFTQQILIKEESGLKMRKVIILLFTQTVIQLKKCLFHLIWIRWSKESKTRNQILLEWKMVGISKMNANSFLLQRAWPIQDYSILEMVDMVANFLTKNNWDICSAPTKTKTKKVLLRNKTASKFKMKTASLMFLSQRKRRNLTQAHSMFQMSSQSYLKVLILLTKPFQSQPTQ